MKSNPVCTICGKTCENEWGNNPDPFLRKSGARCCNECNERFVIPARLLQTKLSPANFELARLRVLNQYGIKDEEDVM